MMKNGPSRFNHVPLVTWGETVVVVKVPRWLIHCVVLVDSWVVLGNMLSSALPPLRSAMRQNDRLVVSPIGPTVLFFDSGLAKGRTKRGASFVDRFTVRSFPTLNDCNETLSCLSVVVLMRFIFFLLLSILFPSQSL